MKDQQETKKLNLDLDLYRNDTDLYKPRKKIGQGKLSVFSIILEKLIEKFRNETKKEDKNKFEVIK